MAAWADSLIRFLTWGGGETRSLSDDSFTPVGYSDASNQPSGLVSFYAAVRHIVDFLATLPVDSYRDDGDAKLPAPTPQLFKRLNDRGDIGVGAWIGQWAYGIAVHGNSVGWVTAWDGFGLPTAIRWLNRVDWSFDEWSKQWYVYGHPVASQMIVHSTWVVPPGKTLGLSPLEAFPEFWRSGNAAQAYADVSRGGGIPPTHLKNTAKKLDAGEAGAVQSRAVKSFASGKPFVTGNDWELAIPQIPPNQAQFLETLQYGATQTASIFGIDPREIGGNAPNGSITYANDESRSLNRANNMRPYVVRFEQMVNRLLPERQFIRLNVDATIRTDIKTRTEVIGAQLADGRLNLDEARALEDRPPLPNRQGQTYNVPTPINAPPSTRGAIESIEKAIVVHKTERPDGPPESVPAEDAEPTQQTGDTP